MISLIALTGCAGTPAPITPAPIPQNSLVRRFEAALCLRAAEHGQPLVWRDSAASTIATTLKKSGIAPSPDRPSTWKTFLKSHADVIAAADFFTVDVWTKRGLVTNYVFFVIHHATRVVEIAGITPNPDGNFMAQVARNLTDPVDGFLRDKKFLILDNDTSFAKKFCDILEDAGVKIVRTAIQAPDMNSIAERFVGSVRRGVGGTSCSPDHPNPATRLSHPFSQPSTHELTRLQPKHSARNPTHQTHRSPTATSQTV
ncbi:MAG: transposase InsO family protein, partial [Neolewinella sp.]